MPKIDFEFSGTVKSANVQQATDVTGRKVDVTSMEAEELCAKLATGELSVQLVNYLRVKTHPNQRVEEQLSAFEPNKD